MPEFTVAIHEATGPLATIALNDPQRRNALSVAMFDALDEAIARVRDDASVRVILLRGEGKIFCAGFDLAACADDPSMMATFIHRLSSLNRALRRLSQPVVAAAHGAAIAGGCALLSACDFVFVEAAAKLGYPVHRIGVSPAVTLPTLTQATGHGPARALVLAGELITGAEAHRIGLATRAIEGTDAMFKAAEDHCAMLAAKPPKALRATKQWLNELDGSLDNAVFDRAAEASASLTAGEEAVAMLSRAWKK